MSTDQVRRANLAAIACDSRPQLPDGFRRSSTRVGTLLGAARTGLSVYELPPGQAVSPYHYEDPEEEWLLVVSGTPTLRHPGGEDQLGRQTSSSFPPDPPEHTTFGTTASHPPASRCSPRSPPVGAVVYPDSDMIQLFTTDGQDDLVVKRSNAQDAIAPWTSWRRQHRHRHVGRQTRLPGDHRARESGVRPGNPEASLGGGHGDGSRRGRRLRPDLCLTALRERAQDVYDVRTG